MSKVTLLFEKLKRRLSALEHLLPASTSTNLYPQEDQDRMLGYRLLCHAEFEGFFEALALLAVAEVWPKAKNAQTVSVAAQELIDYGERVNYPPRKVTGTPQALLAMLEMVVRDLTNKASTNNGITEKDILKLFLPFGIDPYKLDLAWLQALNFMAAFRGDVAHNSWDNATYAETTPEAERKAVQDVLGGIPQLISWVESFIAYA